MLIAWKFDYMTTQLKTESRFSRKIFVGRINRHFPLLRPIINWVRFITFRHKCPTYPEPDTQYTDGTWVERKVTKDQSLIEEYLSSKLKADSRILHVGIGSSSVAQKWPGCTIDGITVMESEKKFADSLGLPNYQTYVMDKNDTLALKNLLGHYHFIIDNDIAAYACCKTHFEDMLRIYFSLLKDGGRILVGAISVTYFDSGFPLPNKYFKEVASKTGLELVSQEGILILKK